MANITDNTSGDIDGIDFDDATHGINKEKAIKNPNRLDDQYRSTTDLDNTLGFNITRRHEGLVEDQTGDDVSTRTELDVGNFNANTDKIDEGNT